MQRLISKTLPHGLFLAAVLQVLLPGAISAEIVCPGTYGGHLQGIAVDEAGNLYWPFTVKLVKTDGHGKLLNEVAVPSHHGDLTYHEGKVYCAVNLGEFNREPGHADNWDYVYEAGDLSLLAKHKIPEVVHGAGGMAHHDGRFFVVGGLPKGYQENYVYEFDKQFRFVRRHVIPSGYTLLGIQTACRAHGFWWFGCYGKELLKTDDSFALLGKYDLDYGTGIVGAPDGKLLKGISHREGEQWRGSASVTPMPKSGAGAAQ